MDPIADMLTIIRNGLSTRRELVLVPFSKLKLAIAKKMAQEGFIASAEEVGDGNAKKISIRLRYRKDGMPYIQSVQRVSRSGRRVYVKYDEIRRVRNGLGIEILSTSKGIMTAQEARAAAAGGEVLCQMY